MSAHLHHFRLLPLAAQHAAIRRLARSGMPVTTVAAITGLNLRVILSVLSETNPGVLPVLETKT